MLIEHLCWLGLALIHLVPTLALFRPALLTRLYGLEPGTDIFTLMHHRAALFGVIMMIALWAAFQPLVRPLALVAIGISMASFLILWWRAGTPARLKPIALADLIGVPLWLVAAAPVVQGFAAGGP